MKISYACPIDLNLLSFIIQVHGLFLYPIVNLESFKFFYRMYSFTKELYLFSDKKKKEIYSLFINPNWKEISFSFVVKLLKLLLFLFFLFVCAWRSDERLQPEGFGPERNCVLEYLLEIKFFSFLFLFLVLFFFPPLPLLYLF